MTLHAVITEPEWNSIRSLAEKVAREVSGSKGDWFTTGRVIKRDEKNRLVWISGMGHTPLPVVGFEYDVRYYDTDRKGHLIVRNARAKVVVPAVGQTVFIAFELGSSRLPRCIGVVQGKNYLEMEED